MPSKYAAQYIERAKKEVENFDWACRVLRFDPDNPAQQDALVKALKGIGAHGTIRLARRFPFVTNETEFLMVADVGLHFYWLTLDFWQEKRAAEGAPEIF